MTRLLLTVPEAARALAISRGKLYELFAGELVRSVRIDGSRRVPVEALETYVAHLLDEEEAANAKAAPPARGGRRRHLRLGRQAAKGQR